MQEKFTDIETILNATIEGILLIENGFIYNVNNSILKILEYEEKNELIGNLAAGVILPTSSEKFTEYNQEIFQEVSLLTKNGNVIPAIIQIKDISLLDKELKMVSILDLTELKKKEALLLKQSKLAAMGEMISMIAHQWRQPLSAISVSTSNLKMKIAMRKLTPEYCTKKIDEINNYVKYMAGTIDDFRNFFKKDKEKDRVFLYDIIYNAIEMLIASLRANSITVNLIEEDLKEIYTYRNELLQVFLNLLNNAQDAFNDLEMENKTIDIYFEKGKDYQKIFFQDNAGGIPKNIIDCIFDPYFSTKSNKNGTGLGLYMSKTILEEHCKGEIFVTNKNNGACFEIKIATH